mgnify:CR=1 FL=1
MKYKIRFSVLVFVAFIASLVSFSSYAKSTVNEIRIGERKTSTRIVVEVDNLDKHEVFIVSNPDRLVIDIEDSKIKVPLKELESISGKFIKSMRYGRPEKGKLRIVADLTKAVDIKQKFVIEPNKSAKYHRIVVDVEDGIALADSGALQDAEDSAENSQEVNKKNNVEDENREIPTPASMQFQASKKSADTGDIKQEIVGPSPIPQLENTTENLKPLSIKPDSIAKKDIKDPKEVDNKSTKKPEVQNNKAKARKPVIVIDPGHGGIDPGAIGQSQTYEKTITFQYAIALKDALEKSGNYKVVLTRKGDYFVNLRERVAIAREAKGDLFISLHADSHPNPKTRGLSVYTLSEKASDREAAALARKANREDIIEGVDLKKESNDLQTLLIDMVQRDTKNNSAEFASMLVKHLGSEARLLKNTHRFAGFVVLTGADVPSVLVELGYMSNKMEEKELKTKAYREKLVGAMAQAINDFFKNNKFPE